MAKKADKKSSAFKEFFVHYSKIITPAVVIIILCLGGLFILMPKYDEVRVSGVLNLENKREELQNKLQYFDQLKELQSNFSKLSSRDIQNLNLSLPDDSDNAGIFVQLENIAEVSGFDLLSVDISPSQDVRAVSQKLADDVAKLNISMTVSGGNYNNLKNLLEELELNFRLFDINSINFSSGSNLYTLNLSTYYFNSK